MTISKKSAKSTKATATPPPAANATKLVAAKPSPTAPKPTAATTTRVAASVVGRSKHHKLIRDSFAMPKTEYATLAELKLRAGKLAKPAKKSEILRAGVAALVAMNDKAFLAALNAVPSIKTGRPKATDGNDEKLLG